MILVQSDLGELAALRDYQAQFADGILLVDPETPVPWCGDWTVRDLVLHLAGVHHWAAAKAARRPEPALALDASDPAAAYAQCADGLYSVLTTLDPDALADTLLDDGLPVEQRPAGTVRFWHRRQALETLVHLWDLRTAGGLPFEPGADAWVDCLDEVVTVMHPRQLRLGRIAPPAVRVRLVATDADADYVLDRSPSGPDVVVRGPIRSLALLAWGRVAASDPALTVEGDRDGLASVLAAGLTP